MSDLLCETHRQTKQDTQSIWEVTADLVQQHFRATTYFKNDQYCSSSFSTRPPLQEYVFRVDPLTSLGLNSDSIVCYRMGDVVRAHASEVPELLPCGYLVGDNNIIKVNLKGTKQGVLIPGLQQRHRYVKYVIVTLMSCFISV